MTLTVTLPVHNGMPYLVQAVESILGQSYGDFEFRIIDDGSSDDSPAYLRSLRDPRIKLLLRENRGLGATLNQLFDQSATDYVARMDADDISERDRIEKQMAFLEAHEDVVMLGTGIAFFVEGRAVDGFVPPAEHADIRRRLLQRRSGVNHPTLIVKRKAWAAVGGYRFARAGEDLDFCLRLCDFGRAANLPEPLYRYRIRAESLSFNTREETNLGYAFAVACARARERRMPEPDLEAFREARNRRSMLARAPEIMATAGQQLYRLSVMRRAQGRSMISRAYLLGAAVCLPHVAWSRLTPWGAS